MAESEFLQYQDANGDGLIDACGELPEVSEGCPGCIPNPCFLVPIWQNRRKWEPFLNEKICKYQITKGTPRTTTFPGQKDQAPVDHGVGAQKEQAPEDHGVGSAARGTDIGDFEEPERTTEAGAADPDPGARVSDEIFDEYADEIIEALLTAYNKDQSENSKNIIKTYLEYTDWDLKPRPMSRLKLLYSVPYEVLQSIPEALPEEEEEVGTSDIEVTFLAEDLHLKLIRVRKGLYLYNRYRNVYQSTEGAGIFYLNPGDHGKPQVFDLENYGDNGFGPNKSLMGQVWTDLRDFLERKGYYINPFVLRHKKKKVGSITFTFTYDYKVKKIVIYTEACPLDPVVVDGKKRQLAQTSQAYSDVTAMAYLVRLADMETDLVARAPMEWTEFLVKYTYPEVFVTAYPEELYEDMGVSACIASALSAEGKQIGQDILDSAFSLGDAIAYQWRDALCSTDPDEIKELREKVGYTITRGQLRRRTQYMEGSETIGGEAVPVAEYDPRATGGQSVFNPKSAGEDWRLSAAGQEEIVAGYQEDSLSGAPSTVIGLAKMQANGYLEENPMLFDYLCTWLGGQGRKAYWADFSESLNRLKLCGFLDLMAQVIQCLTGGLTLEEALGSIIKATFEGMSVDSFSKFFVGLSAEEQAELDELVKQKLESGELFDSPGMEAVSDEVVGNYGEDVDLTGSTIFDEERGWQGFDKWVEAKQKTTFTGRDLDRSTVEPNLIEIGATRYDPSGYGGMTESQYDSYMEQSRRTLAPSSDGGDSWTEYFAGTTEELSDTVIIEAYAKALLEKFEGAELELIDKLNALPGAPLVASIIATTTCPTPAFMTPSFSEIIKDFQLPWICGREFEWPSWAFENPLKYLLNWKDILYVLFIVARELIEQALIQIVFSLMVKLCQLIGDTICRALEVAGDVTAALATGNRDGLRNVIRESICGPDVADEMLDQTIVDMVALMGDAGARLASDESVLEMAANWSSLVSETELYSLVVGGASAEQHREAAQAIAIYMSYEYPEFTALHNETGVLSMFKNMGNLMPVEFRDNLQKFLDAAPANTMKPANPTLCATPEQIEKFCETRALLLQDRASPEQIKKLCDRQDTRDNLEALIKPFQNMDNHIACNMPALVSDPGCDDGILPYEPEESVTATTSMLSKQLEALQSDFSTDMLGNGPFEKNWGMMNMILSDTMASPLTVHHRKAANGWPSKNYVNFYTLDTEDSAEVGSADGKLYRQKGAYPYKVAGWLQQQLEGLTPTYNSNNELQNDDRLPFDFDDYEKGSHNVVNTLLLPDFGYNYEIDVDHETNSVVFTELARKATPDINLFFEDNNLGRRSTGEEPFNWGFDVGFFNADFVRDPDPETGELRIYNSPRDMSRIQIHTYQNEKPILQGALAGVTLPASKHLAALYALSIPPSMSVDLKYEFVAIDDTLEQVGIDTLSLYPEFMAMFDNESVTYDSNGNIIHSANRDYSPPVNLLYEMLKEAGYSSTLSNMKERYDRNMSSITKTIMSDVAANEDGFLYGAGFDSLTADELEYVVDKGQTLSPGGTLYSDAEMPHEDDPNQARPIKNRDQILGISRMEWLIKNGQKEGENRVFYLDPTLYGGNYMRPGIYIKPLQNKGWLGFVDVLFPEMSPCKPQKSDLVDFGEIEDQISESYPNIPEDERLLQHPDCSEEWPFARILDRSAVSGLQGLITAAIRIYASAHFIKSMATFTKFSPKFPEVFSPLYASYVVENMEESFKDASYEDRSPFKDVEFWYAFLEQAVQMYSRRLESEEIEAPPHVVGAITRLNDMQEWWPYPTKGMREDDWDAHETKRKWFQLKNYRYEKVLQAVRAHEEDAKLILTEMVATELNYMGEKFISNLDVVGMTPDVFDLDYYLLENLAQGGENLTIDHEIKYTYPNLPTIPIEEDVDMKFHKAGEEAYYTDGAEFVVFEDNDLENEYHIGQQYIGYYVVHINDEGDIVFLAGEEYIKNTEEPDADQLIVQSEYVQDVLAPLVNQTSVDIGDIAEWQPPSIRASDDYAFVIEKYIKVADEIMSPTDAVNLIMSENSDLAVNISDVYPGPEGNELRLVETDEGSPVGVEGELGVRYGVLFSISIDGAKYAITSAEVDALDLPLSEFKTLEANSKLLLCLINLLKEDGKFKLISKYIFPLSKITATTAIYNDMAFLSSIGEITVPEGQTWHRWDPNITDGKPGMYVDLIYERDRNSDTEYVADIDIWGVEGWAHYEDRARTTTFKTYDDWEKELLINSKRQIKRLFKSYYNSRDFAPYGSGVRPGQAFMASLKARLVPMTGQKLLPWWKKRKLRSNPFNANGELCENED